MNTSQFMDKQIMDLTSSSSPPPPPNQSAKDFVDLIKPPHDANDHHQNNNSYNGIKPEEILPSYDFQPLRPLDSTTGRAWNSVDSNSTVPTTAKNYGGLDFVEVGKESGAGVDVVSEIDKAMKKYVDDLLLVLDGVSARLTQLESRTRHLENSVDEVKVAVANNHGSSDGKMRQLENILREVQTGVHVLKDKQEIVEAQLQVAKLQVSKADKQQPETPNPGHMDTTQQAASAPPQSHQLLPPVTCPQSIPLVPVPPPAAAPLPLPQINLPPLTPIPNQFPQNQIPSVPQRDPYHPPPGQTPDPPNPQYQVPATQQPQPPPAAPPHQQYPPAPQPQHSQPPQLPQPQLPLVHHAEETSYIPPHSYPPSLRPPSSLPSSGAPPSQPYYGAPPNLYDQASSRPSSGFSSGLVPQSGPMELYPYGGSPSQYGSNPTMKPQQLSSQSGGGGGYPQLPTARILPQALPTATSVGTGPGSPGAGNRVPVDDIVDKLTNMGFPRDHVRATVRKLSENGQSVDLNTVLDRLMNDGEVQPQRGWFGR